METEPVTIRSVKQLIWGVVGRWSEINAPRLGAALSYYTMLSIAPLLVVCIAIAGMVFGEQAARGQIVGQIHGLVGPQGGQAIQTMLENAHKPGAGLLAGLFGILTLLFGASGVFIELRDALNLIWGVRAKNNAGFKAMVRDRFTSFAIVVGVGFLLMVSLLASAAIAAVEHFFSGFLPVPAPLLEATNALVTFVGVTMAFALLYKVMPDVRIEWRDVWIGAGVTAALFSMGKFLIGFYLGKAAPGSAYGAAGSLVVFLVWVYYSAQIFYLGAEFTHAFAERHGSRAQTRKVRGAAHGAPQPSPI
jgi:membrane protein